VVDGPVDGYTTSQFIYLFTLFSTAHPVRVRVGALTLEESLLMFYSAWIQRTRQYAPARMKVPSRGAGESGSARSLSESATTVVPTPSCRRASLPRLLAVWFFAATGFTSLAGAQSPQILLANATVRTLAGQPGVFDPYTDGVGSAATFNGPNNVALDSSGAIALIVSSTVRGRSAWDT
jgi:hypothetical protein